MVFEPTFEEFDAEAAAREAALSNPVDPNVVDPETVVHATHAIDPEAPADTETALTEDDDLEDDLAAGLEGAADPALSDEASTDDLPPYGEE
ncbi:MAG TPA: hypothetical protein DCR63_08140 [Microbacterium sp.]|nr:hypothetical protein [Microbacterium sp.]